MAQFPVAKVPFSQRLFGSSDSKKSHWQVLGLCALAFLVTTFFEVFARFGLPKGFYITLAEVGSSIVAIVLLTRRIRHASLRTEKTVSWFLLAFFLLIGFADGSYALHYYFLEKTNKSLYSVLVTTFPYALSYLCAFLAIWYCFSRSSPTFFLRKTAIIPLALSIPFALSVLLPSLQIGIEMFGVGPFILGRIGNFVCSFLLLNIGILAVLVSRSLFWAFFSAGAVQLIIVNWSLSAQRFLGLPYEFGFYEYVWAFGKFLTLASLIVWRNQDFQPQRFERDSLIGQTRLAIFTVVTSLLLLIHFLTPLDIYSIEFISLIFICGSLSSILLGQLLSEKITAFAVRLGDMVNTGHAEALTPATLQQYPIELRECYEQLFAWQIEAERKNIELELKIGSLTRQVAHDIRSPLSALDVILTGSPEIARDKQELIRASTRRIREIADDLLMVNKLEPQQPDSVELQSVPLLPLLESLIAEKKAQFASKSGTEICLHTIPSRVEVCSKIDPKAFRRVISNLMNNALEAIRAEGSVSVTASATPDWVVIVLEDTGEGIAPEHLPRIFQKGVSIGKAEGSGIGLYHAKTQVESWGGNLNIESTLHLGTRVTLRLPQVSS